MCYGKIGAPRTLCAFKCIINESLGIIPASEKIGGSDELLRIQGLRMDTRTYRYGPIQASICAQQDDGPKVYKVFCFTCFLVYSSVKFPSGLQITSMSKGLRELLVSVSCAN